jgi:hypothetical protein
MGSMRLGGWAAAALVMTLGACAGGAGNPAVIGVGSYSGGYVSGEARLGYGAVQVVVRGTPFVGLGQTATDAAVLAAVQNQGFYHTDYVAGKVPNSPYRVAAVFNPPANLDPVQICAVGPDRLAANLGGQPAGPRVPLVMALCRGDQRMSGADGTVPAPAGPNDPAFRTAMGDYMMVLVPATNPMRPPPNDTIP